MNFFAYLNSKWQRILRNSTLESKFKFCRGSCKEVLHFSLSVSAHSGLKMDQFCPKVKQGPIVSNFYLPIG